MKKGRRNDLKNPWVPEMLLAIVFLLFLAIQMNERLDLTTSRTLVTLEDRGRYLYLQTDPELKECHFDGAVIRNKGLEFWGKLHKMIGEKVEITGRCGSTRHLHVKRIYLHNSRTIRINHEEIKHDDRK